MAIRLCVVGPGRVGQALGRRWAERGLQLEGFVGRSPGSAAAAVAFCRAGRALQPPELRAAHVVVFAVGDAELAAAVADCARAAAPLRPCSLWLHTSGRHGLEVLAPLEPLPVRRGALHPVCPFPDAATGLANLQGRPAVLLDGGGAGRLLARLATALGMQPMPASVAGDRALYHAACVLAGNGLTALFSAAEGVLQAAATLPPAAGRQLVAGLMAAALDDCRARGPVAALSGPVLRGDAATVAAHLRALAAPGPWPAAALYRELQRLCLQLAEDRGLPAGKLAALRELLAPEAP